VIVIDLPRGLLAVTLALFGCGEPLPPSAPRPAPPPSASVAPSAAMGALEQIQSDARGLDPLVSSPFTHRFLAAVAGLPHVAPRHLWHDAEKTRFFTEREAAALPAAERSALLPFEANEEYYYTTRYGSPLSYARPLDILAENGRSIPPAAKILDFGCGYLGHLRLFASLGLDATGIDVDPLLRVLYAEPGDQGEIRGAGGAGAGRVRLVDGSFPGDPAIVAAVGSGYDLILSKNVLKRGYVHPERPADPKRLVHLGAPDGVVLASFFAALKPGGAMLVYNICPALSPPDKPFVPWSDGRSPFSRQQWEAAGFVVRVFDRDDTPAVRAMGHALGWDCGEDAMDLVNDLSVLYTLVERPGP
jgi:SAM-dependent methyltransferase